MSKLKPLITPETITSEVAPSLRNVPLTQEVNPVINTVDAPATPPVVVADAKSPFNSKINWLGVILTLIGALELLQQMNLLDTLVPNPDLRAQISGIILFVGGILAIVLRTFFTYRPTTSTNVSSNVE